MTFFLWLCLLCLVAAWTTFGVLCVRLVSNISIRILMVLAWLAATGVALWHEHYVATVSVLCWGAGFVGSIAVALERLSHQITKNRLDYWRDQFNRLSIDRGRPSPRIDVQEAWKCRGCGIAFDSIAEALTCRFCNPKCLDCGCSVSRTGHGRCAPCDEAKDRAAYLAKPTVRLADYLQEHPEGHLCIEGYRFISAADLPRYRDELGDMSTVETCEVRRGFSLDAFDIMESALDEHHEDAVEDVDTQELQTLLDNWSEGQHVESWFADGRRIHPDDLGDKGRENE